MSTTHCDTFQPPFTDKVLREMFRRVGADYDAVKDDVAYWKEKDAEGRAWYERFQWSREEQNDYVLWLAGEIVKEKGYKHLKAGLKRSDESRHGAIYVAWKLVGNYGFVCKEDVEKKI